MSVFKRKAVTAAAAAALILAAGAMEYLSPKISKLLDDFDRRFVSSQTTAEYPLPSKDAADKSNTLEICFIDAGQAESVLVVNPDGDFMLIDAGANSSEANVLKYLEERGVDELEYLVLTHPHEDHIGSADAVLDEYSAKKVLMPNVATNTSSFERVIEALEKAKDTEVEAPFPGDTYNFGECLLTVFSPENPDGINLNDASIVMKLEWGESSVLFTGDAEKKIEKKLLSSDFDLDCDLLDMGHHGSSTSSCEEFLKAVSPDIAVISCGVGNDYGHPHIETLESLKKYGVEYYRTDLDGNVVILFDENGEYAVRCSR